MGEFDFSEPIKAPSGADLQHLVNRQLLNSIIAGLGSVGGGDVASYLGAQMEQPNGYYPSNDIVTNVLQATAPSAYTGQVTRNLSESPARFRIGGHLVTMEGYLWNNINGIEITGDNQVAGITSYEVEFWCSGADLTIELRNEPGTTAYGATDYLIVVDDMIMPPSSGGSNIATIQNGWNHTPETTAVRYHTIQFSTARVRKIRIFMGNLSIAQVRIPGASDIWPAPPRFKCAFIADSWGHTAVNSTEGDIMGGVIPNELALATGWEVWNLSQGGTGYNHPGAGGGTSTFGSADRLDALSNIPEMDLIIVLGGGNDTNRTRATVISDANACWSAIKTARPTTPLVVVGAQPGNLIAGIDSLNADLKGAALSNDDVDVFIDMYEPEEWISGTSGHMEDRDGNGSRDMFITNEALVDLHPGHAGSRNIAQRLARALRGVA